MKSYQEGIDEGRFAVVRLPEDNFEKDVAIKMRDGTVLRANVFRPEIAQRAPVVMTFTMYDKDAHPAELLADFAELRESLGLGLAASLSLSAPLLRHQTRLIGSRTVMLLFMSTFAVLVGLKERQIRLGKTLLRIMGNSLIGREHKIGVMDGLLFTVFHSWRFHSGTPQRLGQNTSQQSFPGRG